MTINPLGWSWPTGAPIGRPADGRPVSEPVILILVVLALLATGVMMVYSASRSVQAAADGYYFGRQVFFLPLALGVMAAGALLPYRWLNRGWLVIALLVVTVALLGLVLVFGEARGGATRWFVFQAGPLRLNFQPSELAKFVVVLFLAWYFSRPGARPRSFVRGFLPAVAVFGLVTALIVKEDFGTGALVGAVSVLVCLIAGWRWWFPLLLIGPGLVGFYVAVVQVPFRLERLRVWLDPWKYYDGPGWHICQSLMAVGSGGLTGVGLGGGIQKLYVPENATDFVFAVLCEETGLLGALLVMGLFAVFVWRGSRVVRDAPDRFGFLLASGILLVIGLQTVLNIGVVTGALPAKGISLPFISYGGSGLVMMCFAAGVLASVSRRRDADRRDAVAEPLRHLAGAAARPRNGADCPSAQR